MSFRNITPDRALFLSQHRTIINRFRTIVKLSKLIKVHDRYLAEFGIRSVPELLAACGIPLSRQFDIVLGLASMPPRGRDALQKLFDRDADARFALEEKLKKARQELAQLRRRPLSTFNEIEEISTKISQVQDTIRVLEAQLHKIPQPEENGAIKSVFKYAMDQKLEKERFIVYRGDNTSYPYHLTEKTQELILTALSERDYIRGKIERKQALEPKDVDVVLHEIMRLIPKPRRIKLDEPVDIEGEQEPTPESTEIGEPAA